MSTNVKEKRGKKKGNEWKCEANLDTITRPYDHVLFYAWAGTKRLIRAEPPLEFPNLNPYQGFKGKIFIVQYYLQFETNYYEQWLLLYQNPVVQSTPNCKKYDTSSRGNEYAFQTNFGYQHLGFLDCPSWIAARKKDLVRASCPDSGVTQFKISYAFDFPQPRPALLEFIRLPFDCPSQDSCREMPNDVDSANRVLNFTPKHTIFGGIFESLRRFSCVVSSAFGLSWKLFSPPCNHSFLGMASPDRIDISSSDSDSDLREIDNYRDVSDESPTRDATSSVTSRILPTWASSSHSNLTGDNGISQKHLHSSPPHPKRQIISDDISIRPHKRFNSVGTAGPSTFRASGNVPQRHMNNLIENVGTSEVHGTHGKSIQHGTWTIAANGKNSTKENINRDTGNNLSLVEKKGNRSLPPSFVQGVHTSAIPLIGSSDPFHHTGLGEDERFVYEAAVQDLYQPTKEATLPNGLLSVSLLRHQKIALAWMLTKESSGLCLGGILADDQGLGKTVSIIALIQMQNILEARSKSKRSCNTTAEALNLDDDEDGNGGHVALDGDNKIEDSGVAILPQESNALTGFHSKRPTAGTLVVCPASVIRQWSRELEDKVTEEAKLRVLIYHGANRTKSPSILAKYDVVLTTYAIVTNEVPKQPLVEEDDDEQKDGERHGLSSAFSLEKKRKKSSGNKKLKKGKGGIDMSVFDNICGTLARVKWSRVVLDESQTIKNHRTQVARACCSLRAKRRWCLSGTPIQNSVDELFSYFRFLRYDPYDKFKVFGASIKSLISRDSARGYQKLQIVLRNIMLRRTKGTLIDGKPIITLPPKRIQLSKVEFTPEEKNFYSKLEADSQKQFKAYAAAGTVNQNYANILLMLLRLRQACDHPLLVHGFGAADPIEKEAHNITERIPREMLENLWSLLETSLAICCVCKDPPENAVVTMCGHVFCYQCVSDYITGEDNTCPVPECKEQLGTDNVFSKSTLRRCVSGDSDGGTDVAFSLDESKVLRSDYISSKIKRAIDILKLHCISKSHNSQLCGAARYDGGASSSSDVQLISDSRGSEKAIVFSQWTSMLDLVEMSLKNNHISYRRLDGTMSIAARDKAVKDFNSDPEVDVMLMSLKAGNLGLNMVAASRVILLDLWWNPTTEDQAIDRAHRIGQTRPVTVSRITIKDTVEDRILSLQEDKRKMVASAFGEDQSGGHGARLTPEDVRFLFNL